MIDIAKDGDGMQAAVIELLEEAFFRSSQRRQCDRMDDEDYERTLGRGPQRTLSPGYYRWAGYLLTLEEMRDCGIPISELQAVEVDGLLEVHRARHTFNVAHPCCSCGQRLEGRWVDECPGCFAKFRKAA